MQIETGDKDYYTVNMSGYLDKILDNNRINMRHTSYPAGPELTESNETDELLPLKEQERFHSEVAKVLFIAKRVRMSVLTAVSVLASRVNKATVKDRAKLDKIFGYLSKSREMVMKYKCGGNVEPFAYADASWATEADMHGRTGVVLTLAGCAIGAWSYRQKMVTKDSTEAELVALSDAVSEILWMRHLLLAQGYNIGPTTLYQDNQAVIDLMRSERRTKQRTKHLNVRYFHARDLELSGQIKIQWKSTHLMLADLMTKPLQSTSFTNLTMLLTGNASVVNGEVVAKSV